MKRKRTLIAGVVIILLFSAIFLFIKKQETDHRATTTRRDVTIAQTANLPTQMEKSTPIPPVPGSVEPIVGASNDKPQIAAAKVEPPAQIKPEKVSSSTMPLVKDGKIVQDPLAREALAQVGLDADAELYWFAAINDPSLPKSERQDLIDDLNEEGLPDPKHPTMDDLPLILSRLAIIEEIAPSIPEELDWKESYDDLLNLAAVATGGGKPVE